MNKIFRLLALLSAVVASSAAQAATYNYSYSFTGGSVVSGSFDGTASGNLITGLSNITASLNSVAFNGSGSLYGSRWDNSISNWASGGAVASFDGTQNNFLFIDVDYPNSFSWTNYFYAIPYGTATTSLDYSCLAGCAQLATDTYNATHWSLTGGNATPEPESLLLVALALLGVVATRRKSKA